jgi:hypothetical protein
MDIHSASRCTKGPPPATGQEKMPRRQGKAQVHLTSGGWIHERFSIHDPKKRSVVGNTRMYMMEARSVADELAQRSTSEGGTTVSQWARTVERFFRRKPAPWGDGRQEAAMTQVSKRALLAGNTGAGCMHRLMTTPRISQAQSSPARSAATA